jgi:hypothetical protein
MRIGDNLNVQMNKLAEAQLSKPVAKMVGWFAEKFGNLSIKATNLVSQIKEAKITNIPQTITGTVGPRIRTMSGMMSSSLLKALLLGEKLKDALMPRESKVEAAPKKEATGLREGGVKITPRQKVSQEKINELKFVEVPDGEKANNTRVLKKALEQEFVGKLQSQTTLVEKELKFHNENKLPKFTSKKNEEQWNLRGNLVKELSGVMQKLNDHAKALNEKNSGIEDFDKLRENMQGSLIEFYESPLHDDAIKLITDIINLENKTEIVKNVRTKISPKGEPNWAQPMTRIGMASMDVGGILYGGKNSDNFVKITGHNNAVAEGNSQLER